MHKQKVLGMSHKGFVFGIFSWMLIFNNTSNVSLLDVFFIIN
jgi:hypothetical protein